MRIQSFEELKRIADEFAAAPSPSVPASESLLSRIADKLLYRHREVMPTAHQLQADRILAGAASLRSFKVHFPEFFYSSAKPFEFCVSDDVKPFEGKSE